MTDQEILDAVRASGITAEQLSTMLAKNVILLAIQQKRAELARAQARREEAVKAADTRFGPAMYALRDELATLEAQAAATL
jgi:hypothetical protein